MKLARNKILAVLLVPLLAVCLACNVPAWINQALQVLPTLAQVALAAAQIYTELTGNTNPDVTLLIQKGFTEAAKDFALAQQLIDQYKKNPKSSGSLLAQIDAALQDAQANLNAILPAIHVFNPQLQAKIAAVVALVVSQVQALEALIPQVAGARAQAAPVNLLTPAQIKAVFGAITGRAL